MSKKLRVNLSLLNFFIFFIFTVITVLTSSFLVYFKNSSNDFKDNMEFIMRRNTKAFLNQISFDLNDIMVTEEIQYKEDEQISNWVRENLKYSKMINDFENIEILRVYYDKDSKGLTSSTVWSLNQSNSILTNENNSEVYKEVLEGKYTDVQHNDLNIKDNNNETLIFEWSNVPISDIYGLNGEDKLVAGKWNPDYSKLVICATITQDKLMEKYNVLHSNIYSLLNLSKILIAMLLFFIIFFMTFVVWKEKKKLFSNK